LAAWTNRRDPEHVARATAQVQEQFPVLRERATALAGNLSGGEQQMLGLAMAFIAKPRLLMIDELSLGLAPTIVGQLVDIVRDIHARGTTVIIVEQSVNVALTLADRAVFMEKGEVRFSGPTAELLERTDILRAVFLEGAAQATGPRKRVKATDRVARRAELVEEYTEEHANPYNAAERGIIDDVIDPAETRRTLIASFDILRTKREELPHRKHGNVPL
jgi:ABC-type multidrug transport system ATPase subunit